MLEFRPEEDLVCWGNSKCKGPGVPIVSRNGKKTDVAIMERIRQGVGGDDTGEVVAGQITLGLVNHFKNFYL